VQRQGSPAAASAGDIEKGVREEAGLKFDPRQHHRRSIRLKGYDYTQPGAYFVTLCAWRRECLFGELLEGVVRLNPVGKIVETEWKRLPRQFPNIRLDAFVIMPNHIHGIIVIIESVRATLSPTPGTSSISQPFPNQSEETHDGSPLPQSSESPGSPPLFAPPVRATHIPAPVASSTASPMPIDPLGDHARSPLHASHPKGLPSGSLGAVMGQFKSRATKRIWALPEYANTPIWQRNYYEHIIRDETAWCRITKYIRHNPLNWQADPLHPATGPNPFYRDK
jgi:putative transposase